MPQPVALFWFRRDLRLDDNAALFHALKGKMPVLPVFIFDTQILDDLSDKTDARVTFIHQAVQQLHQELAQLGSTLLVRQGAPLEVWKDLLQEFPVGAVYSNRDYEPYALNRDQSVKDLLQNAKIPFHQHKDHVIFEKDEVLKDDGTPYTVFTPYSRKWLAKLQSRKQLLPGEAEPVSFYLRSYPTLQYAANFLTTQPAPMPELPEIGFAPSQQSIPPTTVARSLIRNYAQTRDFPGRAGTSRLGIHFRFGTISIREKARHAFGLSDTYLNELIWRDFYSQILAHFPGVVGQPFKAQYARVPWRDAPEEFQRWCEGRTGYPIVDAGMRELNATGFMHNRVRMITASFLTKHLLLDWRLGEAYFAEKLLDFDLASNNGGWQWAAGCGTDAAPYFRIFNPAEQTKKFDPEHQYIRRWVPELGSVRYPPPMVDHAFARQRCLEAYKTALG
ncbi:MAG: deoxyribodipyrimidine photo-lyase [Saprospiraceae bacterium]|nr:deoxyribodipyrimidine photo-lyase [Saprospiraceae bacterium]